MKLSFDSCLSASFKYVPKIPHIICLCSFVNITMDSCIYLYHFNLQHDNNQTISTGPSQLCGQNTGHYYIAIILHCVVIVFVVTL